MTTIHLAIFILSLCGFTALALAMPRHNRQLLNKVLSPASRLVIRAVGWLFLASALGLGMATFNFDVGTVAWLGWLSVAGLVLALVLSSRDAKPTRRPKDKSVGWVERSDKFGWHKFGQLSWPSGRGADAPSHTQQAMVRRDSNVGYRYRATQPTEHQPVSEPRRYGAVRSGLAAAALLIPLAGFAWQLLTTPVKPLHRDDAIHGEIGPWTFSLAEKDQNSPELMAMDIPLKSFVIQFCEGCDADIRMAYLKVRQPRTSRAAGNGFEGRGREKTATIAVPAAARLDDGIWLTVEGKDGQQYSRAFAIEALSPAMATFIGERL